MSPLSPDVQQHLTKVYGLLASLIGVSIIGCLFSMSYQINSSLSHIMTIILAFLLYASQSTPHIPITKQYYRLGLLASFGFFEGISLCPLISYVVDLNDSGSALVLQALIMTSVVFISFSLASMYSPRREFLYLGGFLSSFSLFLFFNALFHTRFSFNISLYGGLILFVLYVLYDTQMIIEKVRSVGAKNSDALHHALELFIDFIQLFVRILIILTEKDKKKKKRDD